MPSPIAHSVTGIVAANYWDRASKTTLGVLATPARLGLLILLANLPDLDFAGDLLLGQRVHHTFTHSIAFALGFSLILAVVLFGLGFSFRWAFGLIMSVYASHIALDMLGGGPGVQLFWPWSAEYVRSSIQFFPSVHHSRGLVDFSHLVFVGFELAYAGLLIWLTKMGGRILRKDMNEELESA